ncbi:MAG: Smr/MutS family protein [Proteobacteria bacterium]|nr:Smr/MutS family protein [Pseudomonadota bacterium]MBU1742316.1 Smr/MutS family protein [Pseudomonadota bacterium]
MSFGDDPIEYAIDGVLDLHTFQPAEAADLVEDYLAECRARGILEVRIIHGKGIGALRRTVLHRLAKLPGIAAVEQAPPHLGGHGATIVRLER